MTTGNASSMGRKLLSGSVLRGGNLVASAAVALFLLPFIVHHLGDRQYGFWSLATSFIGYYGLLDLGLTVAVSQFVGVSLGRRDVVECRAVFNTALRIQTFIGVAALFITGLIAASSPWFSRTPEDAHLFWKVILILGVNAALNFPVKVFGGVLDAELRFDVQAYIYLFGLTLRTALTVWVITAGGGLLQLAWVNLLASIPGFALQIIFAMREAPWARIDRTSLDLKRARSLFSYSVYTAISSVADTLRFQVDSLVISAFIGLAAVTHYRVAGVFAKYYVETIISTINPFHAVLSRLHGAGDRESLERVFLFATKLSCSLSVLICFGLIAWGKPFIMQWMGPNYVDAYLPLVILSIGVLLDVYQSPSIILLNATFNHRFYTYANLSEGVINLAFSLALARSMGIVGVATGTLIGAFLIRIAVQPWWMCKVSGFHYGRYMKFLATNLLICSGVMSVAIALCWWGLRPNFAYLTGSSLCATAIYAGGCWQFFFNGREREQLLSAILNRAHRELQPEAANAVIR
ncbi:MAG: oligosaccharide flippase family protein [Candidatus Acidiferrum sp.]